MPYSHPGLSTRLHCRHNIIEDFGEVILKAYDRFLELEKEIKELKPRARTQQICCSKACSR